MTKRTDDLDARSTQISAGVNKEQRRSQKGADIKRGQEDTEKSSFKEKPADLDVNDWTTLGVLEGQQHWHQSVEEAVDTAQIHGVVGAQRDARHRGQPEWEPTKVQLSGDIGSVMALSICERSCRMTQQARKKKIKVVVNRNYGTKRTKRSY